MKPKEEEIINSINNKMQEIKDQLNQLSTTKNGYNLKMKFGRTEHQIQLVKPPVAQIFMDLAKKITKT
jgi:uncharacterized protein YcfJ